ncbi:MAG: MmgE/PrpD family protein [Pseudooceanicola sp.]|nr:MmgE/PrpD family protein [Pseudooceanicola sp.]
MDLIDTLLDLAQRPHETLPSESMRLARLSFFDWMVCGLAAADEPVTQKLLRFVEEEGGRATASTFGGGRAPARAAALANGTISHALDYDDTHFAHIGHLSVGIYPAAFAAGEEVGGRMKEVHAAFLLGAESAIRVGLALGPGHYERGFHQTATAGAFGATVAAGRLYGLNRDQMRAALGLCSTRASGLKNQFGTMGKPLNAGIAAANGIECARLAALGLTSADDGISGAQGFIATHSDAATGAPDLPNPFLFDDIRYKLHACCHGTHAMIEALLKVQADRSIDAAEVQSVTITVHPKWLNVCDIKQPRTGLEVKFSYVWLAAMVLSGISTSSPMRYTDALANDISLKGLAQKVRVATDPSVADTAAKVALAYADGTEFAQEHDLMAQFPIDEIEGRVIHKAQTMLGERAGTIWGQLTRAGGSDARDIAKSLVFIDGVAESL